MPVRQAAALMRRLGVLFRFRVTAVIMMVGGLPMMVGCLFVMRSGDVMMLTRWVVCFGHDVLHVLAVLQVGAQTHSGPSSLPIGTARPRFPVNIWAIHMRH